MNQYSPKSEKLEKRNIAPHVAAGPVPMANLGELPNISLSQNLFGPSSTSHSHPQNNQKMYDYSYPNPNATNLPLEISNTSSNQIVTPSKYQPNFTDIINQNFTSDCLLLDSLPWQALTNTDSKVLAAVSDKMSQFDKDHKKLTEFISNLCRDFPVEVFLQRPKVLKNILITLEACSDDEYIFSQGSNLSLLTQVEAEKRNKVNLQLEMIENCLNCTNVINRELFSKIKFHKIRQFQCPRDGLPFGTRHNCLMMSHANVTGFKIIQHHDNSLLLENTSSNFSHTLLDNTDMSGLDATGNTSTSYVNQSTLYSSSILRSGSNTQNTEIQHELGNSIESLSIITESGHQQISFQNSFHNRHNQHQLTNSSSFAGNLTHSQNQSTNNSSTNTILNQL